MRDFVNPDASGRGPDYNVGRQTKIPQMRDFCLGYFRDFDLHERLAVATFLEVV